MLSRTGIPVTIAAVAALVFTLAFYPGWLSFDSSYQWWQARTGEISTINGIGIVLLWRAARVLHDGPAPLLILQMLLFWSGAAWLAITSAGLMAHAGTAFLLGMLAAAAHLGWQVRSLDIDDPENCLERFRANGTFGLIVFAAIVLDMGLAAIF